MSSRVQARGLLRWQASSIALSASFGMSAFVMPSADETARQADLLAERAERVREARRGEIDDARARARCGPGTACLLKSHDGREAERVREAVVEALLARERMRERVARAEALLERDGAHHRGLHHPAARLEIVAGLDGAREVLRAELDARRARCRRPSGDRRSSRYASRQCVSASKPVAAVMRGGHRDGELGIEDRRLRQEVRARR